MKTKRILYDQVVITIDGPRMPTAKAKRSQTYRDLGTLRKNIGRVTRSVIRLRPSTLKKFRFSIGR